MNKFQAGMSAELFVAAAYAKQGYNILWPMLTQSRYDFVAEDDEGRFIKVQVKKASWSKTGNYEYLQARLSGKNKMAYNPYLPKDVDEFAFTDLNNIWIAPYSEIGHQTSVCLTSTNPNYKPQTEYDAYSWLLK